MTDWMNGCTSTRAIQKETQKAEREENGIIYITNRGALNCNQIKEDSADGSPLNIQSLV